jgi:hypothetical protein
MGSFAFGSDNQSQGDIPMGKQEQNSAETTAMAGFVKARGRGGAFP